jgi:hypothetical protein
MYRSVFPKLCVATPCGGAELRQGRRQKTIKNWKEKTKNSSLLLLNSNSNLSFLTLFLTNNFNSSDFYFFIITTTYYWQCISQKYIIFKDSSIFIILHFLQFVSRFPKTVLGGGAWKIFKVKGGLNQKSLGTPGIDPYSWRSRALKVIRSH